jgi:protein-S-isoprenylcysteine O-methyltransferase Ste14
MVFLAAKRALRGHRLTLAFSSDTPRFLVENGIYSRVRHPFYLAYTLTWLGGVIAVPGAWTLSTTIVMLILYWAAALLEEKKFASSDYAESYAAYRSRSGMFWPTLG